MNTVETQPSSSTSTLASAKSGDLAVQPLEVIVSWGTELCRADVYERPRIFTIGESGNCDAVVPREALAHDFELLEVSEDGSWIMNVPSGAKIAVADGTTPLVYEDVRFLHGAGYAVALTAGRIVQVTLGEFSFLLRRFEDMPVAPSAPRTIAWSRHTWTIVSVALHGVFLTAAYFMPPSAGAAVGYVDDEAIRRMTARYIPDVAPEPEVPEPAPGGAGGGDEGAPGEEGKAGDVQETRRTGGGVRSRGTDEKTVPTIAQARNAGIIGTLAMLNLGNVNGGPFSAENALSADEVDAYGSEIGLGFSSGVNGLSMDGIGRGGCPPGATGCTGILSQGIGPGFGHGRCDPEEYARIERTLGHAAAAARCVGEGDNGTGIGGPGGIRGPVRRPPPSIHGNATTNGCLSKEAIRRAIQRNTNQFRHCYEQGLQSQPDLGGRVEVQFQIQMSGAVSTAASTARSTLGSAPVESCVATAMRRVSFPQSECPSIVTYPFTFESVQ